MSKSRGNGVEIKDCWMHSVVRSCSSNWQRRLRQFQDGFRLFSNNAGKCECHLPWKPRRRYKAPNFLAFLLIYLWPHWYWRRRRISHATKRFGVLYGLYSAPYGYNVGYARRLRKRIMAKIWVKCSYMSRGIRRSIFIWTLLVNFLTLFGMIMSLACSSCSKLDLCGCWRRNNEMLSSEHF